MPMVKDAPSILLESARRVPADNPELEAILARVKSLDFERVKAKLASKQGWSEELCTQVEDLYRKFLALKLLCTDRGLAPTSSIDEFWHRHILDTRAYQKDCDYLCGTFLHHLPSSGTPAERQQMDEMLAETVALFHTHFGIDPRITPEDHKNIAHCGCRCGCN